MAAFSGGSALEVDESDTMQLIRQAVLFENEDLLCDLVRENPWAFFRIDRHGRTPVMLAAHNGRATSLQLLLSLCPDARDIANSVGKTALHLAAEAGEVAAVRVLLIAGSDPSRMDESGHCALEAAHMAGHEHVAATLIEAIQSENDRVNEQHQRLIAACKEGDCKVVDEIIRSMTDKSKEIVLNGRSPEDDTSLFVACVNGQTEVVRHLLSVGDGHVLVHQSTSDTVLHAAVSSQNVDVLQLILDAYPALVANSNCDGASCLHWAAQSGNVNVVKRLLDHRFPPQYVKEIDLVSSPPYIFPLDVNQGDAECRTALYLAVAKRNVAVVQQLLDFKCTFTDGTQRCPFQVDVYCTRGRTPLMMAAFNQTLQLVGLLIDHGADVNLPLAILDSELSGEEARCIGSGALVEATRADGVHVVHFLLDKGAMDTDNRALSLAASSNNEKLIRVFLTRLVFPDPEFKINKKNVDVGQLQVGQNLLPSALCPSRAAMLNWGGASLESVQADWFISAALQVNPRLRTTRLSLAAITRVDLSSNRLTIFPSVLFQMPSLRSLNLSDNKITFVEMPSYYVSSTSLENLSLKQNQLESLSPQLLSSLPQLSVLDVSRNKLTALPEYIWLCPALKELNVSFNSLSSLPMVGGGRGRGTPRLQPGLIPHSDTTATIGDVSIDEPANVTTKPLLRQNVWQAGINLSKVDDDELFPDFPVTSSNTLVSLNLSNNKFSVFPMCLACTCPRLTTLSLSANQLVSLPPVACVPSHLRSFDVSDNLLKDGFQVPTPYHTVCHAVPPSTATAAMPRRPNSPQRNHRSRSKSAVRSQRSLSVSRHQPPPEAEEACVHKRHDALLWMKTLNLSGNALTAIKVVVAGKLLLPALSVLDVSENQLKSVSSEVAKLSGLSVFNLAGNKDVRELPPEMGQLSRLWSLSLKGCHLKDPLDSMVNTDNCKTVEIVAYLKTILEESKTYHHLRLLVLGGDRVGKSLIWDSLKTEAVQKKAVTQSESIRVAEWKYEAKRAKGEPSLGPVGFSAWDFCGQREYHATHQYFLTRRSLHLVVWRVTDGDAALNDVQRWLVSIQARAPNSCVILVGTHMDQVAAHPNRFPHGYLEDVEAKVRSRFMLADPDKRGLPKIVDLIFLSAKSKSDIKTLLGVVYKGAWEVRVGKERALDQQIPSSYIALMKVVREMALEYRKEGVPAVMSAERFKERAAKRMAAKFGRPFRDDVEVHGGVSFLHDSGEIVHFEDAALRQLVFVCPLWLADFLAATVALRTPPLPTGLLRQDALAPLLKQCPSLFRSSILDLLHKFELSLMCSSRQLIFPSLLPDEYRLRADYPAAGVKISAKMTSWAVRHPKSKSHPPLRAAMSMLSRHSVEEVPVNGRSTAAVPSSSDVIFSFAYDRSQQLRRTYVMAYVPAGFWSRLITRIMGDQNVCRAIEGIFRSASSVDASFVKTASEGELQAEWLVWQTGIEMLVKGHSLFVLKQFCPQAEVRDVDYSNLTVQARDEQKRWRPLPLTDWAIVEILLPSLSITANIDGKKVCMSTDKEGASRLLALVVDLLDTLLEDWYPALGTRFVHTSEGDLLVNRFVPCSKCVEEATEVSRRSHDDNDIEPRSNSMSGVRGSKTTGDLKRVGIVNCFTIEECMLAGREYGWLECSIHGGVHMKDIAPDTVFMDIESSLVIPPDNIRRGRMLGRGAFGFVFRANVKTQSGELLEVAQKMLEPVDPGPNGRASALAAYKAAADKWRRDSLEFACRAYCTSRQELNLLSRMRHANVIGLLGVCVSPLSLVVELAPLGALSQLLASHRKSGSRLALSVIREAAMQVAKALEYLHSAHIIYRDLKSENVLGWRFPPPFSTQTDVLVKLGDYGISRSVLPSGGAKGFGGTEGFMAPEIVRFNGEEEYTQKVDVFSFGMFLYELLTLKLPFEGEEHVKERLLEGARPVLLPNELLVPCSMLDLLVQCWQAQPEARPTSSQLVGFATAPEFSHILDACELEEALAPSCILCVPMGDDLDDPDDFEAQLWVGGKELAVLSCTQYAWVEHRSIAAPCRPRFLCRIREAVWSCEESGDVTVYSVSLHENGTLQLPSLSAPLICAPSLLPSDVLLLVSERELVLLHLSETNSVSLRGTLRSPYPITSAVFVAAHGSRQIWTGHAEGRVSIHHLGADDAFSFSSSLYLPEETAVVRDMAASRDGTLVWITVKQGSRIYCYDVEKRQVSASLDVKKVMPGSETIHTLDVEGTAVSHVTALAVLETTDGPQAYIGTSNGMLIVAHAAQLQPISACRPFSGEISAVCVVEGPREDDGSIKVRGSVSTASSESGLGWVRERVSETVERFRASPAPVLAHQNALIATIGRGFRSLSHRFVSETTLVDSYSAVIWRTDEWA